MVADRILWYVDAYPDFPQDAQFSVDKNWMDKYQNGAEPLNQMEILKIRRWTEGEESEVLETMVWECDTTANVDDASLCEVTQKTVERLIEWMEMLPTYQEHLTTLIAYTLDADEVERVETTKERLNTLADMPEYQALEKARTAAYREAAMPWNREQFEAWKKMAIEQRDRARNGEISVEELRDALK